MTAQTPSVGMIEPPEQGHGSAGGSLGPAPLSYCSSTGAPRLRSLLDEVPVLRAAGAHDAISAKLAETAGCDAVWASGLGISTVHAVPDIGLLSMTELLDSARRMRQATRLPVIADCDSGAEDPNVMQRLVRLYEDSGIAAICIEDKQFPKRNSFRDGNVLVPVDVFARRIEIAKKAQVDPHFMLIARIESFIAGQGMASAVERASRYVEAGADMLLIHSKASEIDELADFALQVGHLDVPLVAVPTTYPQFSVDDLAAAGFRLVIYANQMLRASLRAMSETIEDIVTSRSSQAVESRITSLDGLFDLLGYDEAEQVGAPR